MFHKWAYTCTKTERQHTHPKKHTIHVHTVHCKYHQNIEFWRLSLHVHMHMYLYIEETSYMYMYTTCIYNLCAWRIIKCTNWLYSSTLYVQNLPDKPQLPCYTWPTDCTVQSEETYAKNKNAKSFRFQTLRTHCIHVNVHVLYIMYMCKCDWAYST